ncbi:Protein SQS1 [Cyphellophora attinorum]|uniref:Protein SQS1 n=1 Tax=Cyphellophora attinorum TaxID=1664694 RepID=A0A0N1HHD7_9EURO|nr:Protein SQS1 [Phialophora attinorum]KPI35156.1 Protein SQS1 [Phialophora attinorum]
MGAREKQKAKSRAARKPSSSKSTPSSGFNKYTHKGISSRSSVNEWQSFASSQYGSSPQPAHSLAQEARNTERHGAFGWANTRLRDKPLNFVSAGNLVREEPQSSSLEEDKNVSEVDNGLHNDTSDAEPSPALVENQAVQPASTEDPPQTDGPTEQPVDNSADGNASSSEDEVVFVGRKPGMPVKEQKKSQVDHEPSIKQPVPVPIPRSPEVLTHPPMSSLSDLPMPQQQPSAARPRRRWETRYERRKRQEQEDEDAYLQDYIENLDMDDDEEDEDSGEKDGEADPTTAKPHRRNEHFRFNKSDGLDNAKVQLRAVKSTKKAIVETGLNGWDSADLDAFDDISTTEDETDDVDAERILRHRERVTGKQYLVTTPGTSVDEARWVPAAKLKQARVRELIQVYDISVDERLAVSDDDDSSEEDEDEEDLIDDIGSEQDENNRIMERTARMTDEQIARALDRQERLGMGGDEVKMWNDHDLDDLDDENDFTIDQFMNGDEFIPFSTSKHTSNRGRSKRNKRGRDSFPPAEAFADALEQDPYGAFDVMEWERPSLRPKRKGRKSDFPYDMDGIDDELAAGLVNAWTKDREKKASRKREKQAEREAMLLENAEGSNPDAIKLRIRHFLVSESEELELTPMDAELRAGVHRLAKSLKLTSRSHGKEGKGAGRYPVLNKTSFTKQYTAEDIWEVDALMNLRKFFGKHAYKNAAKSVRSGAVPRGGRGGGGVAAASYMNGAIVGAAAPELGAENRGRVLLEKMGWSAGMGIGAAGNKGSIDNIKHVVKTNKAGLG